MRRCEVARMIPSRVHEATPSSERRVFDRLRLDPATEEWTVLHSLGLSRRGKRPYGEIDFVILVPDRGVVCLEVKGGRIRCEDGVWYTRNRVGDESALSRSPFAQAREGVFGLRDIVQREFGPASDVGRIVYCALVVFPDVPKPPTAPEYEAWEAIDLDDLRGPISSSILSGIKQEEKRVGRKAGVLATPSNLKLLRTFLRPDFDLGIARATTIRRSEERIVSLTEEQYDTLDLFKMNPRCVVEGAAGTGKTVLGLEFVRRKLHEGGRVLFLCYNRLLADWLSEELHGISDEASLSCGTYHGCLRQLILDGSYAEEFRKAESSARGEGKSEDLFGVVYPFYGQLTLAEQDAQADLLILDEAQDLLTQPVLDVLNDWLRGGLAGGRWVMLGDFTRQAIYSRDGSSDWKELLSKYGRDFTHSSLHRNCRNTRCIGEETALLSGFESLPYRLDSQECLPVDYRYYSDRTHASKRLADVLETLHSDGVPMSQVVLLSPHRLNRSVASKLSDWEIIPVNEGRMPQGEREVAFCTIYSFKGLESPTVIMCDMDEMGTDRARALAYVGMSRARSHLVLLLNEQLKDTVSDAVQLKLSKDWDN
jgi:hypothetical protein